MCAICVIAGLSEIVISSMWLSYQPLPSDLDYIASLTQDMVYEKTTPQSMKQLETMVSDWKKSPLEMEQYYGQMISKVLERYHSMEK